MEKELRPHQLPQGCDCITYEDCIRKQNSIIEAQISKAKREILEEAEDIILNNSREKYEHGGIGYLQANTDAVMLKFTALRSKHNL